MADTNVVFGRRLLFLEKFKKLNCWKYRIEDNHYDLSLLGATPCILWRTTIYFIAPYWLSAAIHIAQPYPCSCHDETVQLRPGWVCLPNQGPYLAASYDEVPGWRVNIRMAEMRRGRGEKMPLPQIASHGRKTKMLLRRAKYYHYYNYCSSGNRS